MTIQIVLFGAGGHAGSVIDTLESNGIYNILGILDDFSQSPTAHGYPILGNTGHLLQLLQRHMNLQGIVAIGDNYTRMKVVSKVEELMACENFDTESIHFSWATATHSNASISGSALIERGTIICAGAVVGRNVKIGHHVILNSTSVLEHNCQVDDFAHLAPSVAVGGSCKIGRRSFLGISSCVRHGIAIPQDVVIGANSFVNCDCIENSVYIGSPAKLFRQRRSSDPFL